MSVIVSLVSALSTLIPSDSTDSEPAGAAAVEQALAEAKGLGDREFTVTLGEPDIDSLGGDFINTPQVTIPVYDAPIGDGGELALDLDEFEDMLAALDVDSPAAVTGLEVPIQYIGGNVAVLWDSLGDDTDEAERDDGDAAASAAESEDTEDETETETDTEDADASSGVTVEKTTVTSSGEDAGGDDV